MTTLIWVYIVTICLLCLLAFGIGHDYAINKFKAEAIEYGHAEYLTSEGNEQIFHWK